MKPITVNVSESTYREFQAYAERHDRKTAELIREAMDLYREQKILDSGSRSLRELQPLSVGSVTEPLSQSDDLLGEMTRSI